MCGGTGTGRSDSILARGLSPRVRGNRSREESPKRGNRVYPRVCGGTGHSVKRLIKVAGLSPRVRGNLLDVEPQRMGTTTRVYPRVCGGTGTLPDAAPDDLDGVYPRVCGGTTLPTPT